MGIARSSLWFVRIISILAKYVQGLGSRCSGPEKLSK